MPFAITNNLILTHCGAEICYLSHNSAAAARYNRQGQVHALPPHPVSWAALRQPGYSALAMWAGRHHLGGVNKATYYYARFMKGMYLEQVERFISSLVKH